MTASEAPEPVGEQEETRSRSLADVALDLFVYLPAGVVVSATEDMGEMADKGRARVEQELRNAKLVGRFAVDFGLRQLREQLGRIAGGREEPSQTASEREVPREGAAARTGRRREGGSPVRSAAHPSSAANPPRDPAVDRAIPDYDVLAASQVVRRLDSLTAAELSAVVRHERAGRARRAILHRAEQLLAADRAGGAPPGSGGAEQHP